MNRALISCITQLLVLEPFLLLVVPDSRAGTAESLVPVASDSRAKVAVPLMAFKVQAIKAPDDFF